MTLKVTTFLFMITLKRVSRSRSPDSNFVDPKIASYIHYPCKYLQAYQLVQLDNDFSLGAATRRFRWRNPDTNEIAAIKSRAQGVCMACAKEIIRRSQG
jgi:hypothetical protein